MRALISAVRSEYWLPPTVTGLALKQLPAIAMSSQNVFFVRFGMERPGYPPGVQMMLSPTVTSTLFHCRRNQSSSAAIWAVVGTPFIMTDSPTTPVQRPNPSLRAPYPMAPDVSNDAVEATAGCATLSA